MPPPFLRKKETVIGIIGQTQGVKIAIKPPNNPNKNITHSDLPPIGDSSPSCSAASSNL